MTPLSHYDRKTIALHWITAILVVTLWGLAQIIDFFPSGLPRVFARSTHIGLGIVLALVLITRLHWRLTSGVALPQADAGWPGTLARAVHILLYVLLAAVVLAGLLNASVRNVNFFGLFKIPNIAPGDRSTRQLIGSLHELAANAVLITAGLHAAAALIHHWFLKDGVLRRMLPAK
jgi:cytochrome b561